MFSVSRGIWLFALLMAGLQPGTARAGADGPDYWQVRDVAGDDVLNMRAQASPKAPKVGSIPPDGQCIQNLGCKGGLTYQEYRTLDKAQQKQILKQRPRWCRVRYQGKTGWVAGRYLREGHCPEGAHKRPAAGHAIDPNNQRYRVEGESLQLHNGYARKTIPGTTAIILTEAVGQAAWGDLDGDGREDVAQILIQHTGGSGVFYYLAVAIQGASHDGEPLEAVFLGDRLSMPVLAIDKGVIRVEYRDRSGQQAMAEKPKKEVRRRFRLEGKRIREL